MYEIGKGSTGDPEVVTEITDALHEAAKAVGRDADGVVGMFHHDDATVLFDYLRPGLTTLAQLRETAAGLVGADVTYGYPRISVRQLTDTSALSLAYARVEIRAADGTIQAVNTRVTDVWIRVDGEWRVIHEHASVPVDVDAGTAILEAPISD